MLASPGACLGTGCAEFAASAVARGVNTCDLAASGAGWAGRAAAVPAAVFAAGLLALVGAEQQPGNPAGRTAGADWEHAAAHQQLCPSAAHSAHDELCDVILVPMICLPFSCSNATDDETAETT